MRKIARLGCMILIIMVLFTTTCFASSGKLVLKDTFPKDGATGTSIENMAVKLYFDAKFTADKLGNKNNKAVKLYGPDNKELPVRILYSEKEEGVVLVLMDSTGENSDLVAKGNSDYKVVISKDFQDDAGDTIGEEKTIKFKTVNMGLNTAISTLMMFGMIGVMIFFSARSAKKEATDAAKEKDTKVNPYKEARKTGKSVEEIVEKDQKEKAKRAAKEAKRQAALEEEYEEYSDNYRVKRPRPISEAGSSYVTGRRAIAEAKKAEAEARKAQSKKTKKK